MFLPVALIIVPLLCAFFISLISNSRIRDFIIFFFSGIICILSLTLLFTTYHSEKIQYFSIDIPSIDILFMSIEVFIGIFIVFIGIKYKRLSISVLAFIQTVIMVWFEFSTGHKIYVAYNFFVDKLSILMALVIGVIGSLICVYSVNYMKEFHNQYHKEIKDRSRALLSILFIFISAMFGIIFFNNLTWIYLAWEITTLCSFLLIGYKQTEESRKNALRALLFNLMGGLAFVIGIVFLAKTNGIMELDKLMRIGQAGALLPVILFCFAGLTKSAQMPFSKWLLGAMVAPTPVSALLHSSTMVKAGVYLILRFATILEGTLAGMMIALIGAVTFLFGSFIAISESDAKKILAYSTVANLGLIVLCAGIGTYEALWAAILLIIFHAVSKCLLFLCVGIVEHKLHSRNIEDMTSLIITMPKISIMMQIGMAGMFLAPFGMLIRKWAVLKALVDYNPILAVFVIFGSSATLMYWIKWVGKLIIVTGQREKIEEGISFGQWFSLSGLAVLTIAFCMFFPVMSSVLIEPYIIEIFGISVTMSHGNVVIMSIMLSMIMLFPLSFINYGKQVKVVDAFLCGANTGDGAQFTGSARAVYDIEIKNYYFSKYFGENILLKYGRNIAIALIVIMFIFALNKA
ncbi:ech hydrogenase subunit A [Candidatus Omnitrophus magneticus]|uniref:Ech hydrogenase subunit A n=1 Tax=Candidatus Omnitrophus magneticus TaxID=1609969 RepID=A0A0F0CVB3_9BACT|nr:ech hydrogenase subunit A [Candidatus Omnitrophus magneticus]